MANLERANFEFRSKVLVSTVKEKLRSSNYSHKSPETITKHLEDVVTALKMADDYSSSFKLRLEINKCVRNVMIVRREYNELAKYLMYEYETLKTEGVFKKSGKDEEIKLLTWIINVLLRIKEIEHMNHYISLLENVISSHSSHVFRQKYKWLLYQCKVISYAYSAQINRAIELLLSLEVEREKVPHYPIFVNLNLALLYYYNGDFAQSFDFLAKIILDDSFRKLSPPLQITVLSVELILRVENGDYTYAQNKYTNLRRKYRNYLSRSNYDRDKSFLNLLREIIKEMTRNGISDNLERKIETFIEESPAFEPGSNEAICYHLWLKGFMMKKSYYRLVLEYIGYLNPDRRSLI
jgi:tetratricopeptide (TPR) repeat protein